MGKLIAKKEGSFKEEGSFLALEEGAPKGARLKKKLKKNKIK